MMALDSGHQRNVEGIILKKIDSPYIFNDRSDNWIKLKYDSIKPIGNQYRLSLIKQTISPGPDSLINYKYTTYGSNNRKFKINDIITLFFYNNAPLNPYNGTYKIKNIESFRVNGITSYEFVLQCVTTQFLP
jgi:hypothetical protein